MKTAFLRCHPAVNLVYFFAVAVLGLLFALLAPFPNRKTRLGAAWDRFLDKRFPKRMEPERPDPFVAPLAGDRAPADVAATEQPVADDVTVARPTRAADLDDEPAPSVEPDARDVAAEEKPSSKLDPRFEEDRHEGDDHIRDGKPGDVRPY